MSKKIIAEDGQWNNRKWVMDEFNKLSDQYKRMYRNVASAKLSLQMAGSGEGIGSSDISNEALSLFERTKGNIAELVDINWEISEAEKRIVQRYMKRNSSKMNDKIVAEELVKIASDINGGRMIKATLKSELESKIGALLKKYKADYQGEKLDAKIYRIDYKPDRKTVDVIFDDENMGYLIAGYVSSSVYDEFEKILKDLGYEMVDGDGSRMILEKINKASGVYPAPWTGESYLSH